MRFSPKVLLQARRLLEHHRLVHGPSLKPRSPTTIPCPSGFSIREFNPLLNRILWPHRQVTSHTNWAQISDFRRSTPRLRYIMSHVKIKYSHDIFAPRNKTLALVFLSNILQPYLFSQGFRYGYFYAVTWWLDRTWSWHSYIYLAPAV